MPNPKKSISRANISAVALVVGSILALVASFALSVEAITLAKNSQAVLSCSVSAVLNCASVANHPTATVFGFPNSFLGMMTIPVMLTIGVAILMGAKLPKKFMLLAQIGAIGGLIFALWMLYTSFFVIQVLCPWCLTTDLGMFILIFGLTRYNILHKNLYLSDKWQEKLERLVKKDIDFMVLIGAVVVVVAAILMKYGDSLL